MLRTQRSSTQFSRMNLHTQTKQSSPSCKKNWGAVMAVGSFTPTIQNMLPIFRSSTSWTKSYIYLLVFLWNAHRLTSSNQSLPSHHLSKQDAQRSRCCCAPGHTPQVENQWEVDQRGDGGPRGVESQTILDLNISTRRSTEMTSFTRDTVFLKKWDFFHQQWAE